MSGSRPDSSPTAQNDKGRPAIIAVSAHGRRLAAHIHGELIDGPPAEALAQAWREGRDVIFFGATGIAVRLIAPLLASKHTDPAVVVVDDAARHAISLVSGHEGGANELARRVAKQLGAEPVITTASDVLPQPRLVLGVGCTRGASAEEIEALAREALAEAGASFESVAELATIDLKDDEPGLLAFAARWHWPIRFYTAAELAPVPVSQPSETVRAAVGTPSVAEAAAILSATSGMPGASTAGSAPRLADGLPRAYPKHKSAHATIVVAKWALAGKLSVVGLGPGGRDQLTFHALEALRQAEVVVGYNLYTDMVREWLPLANCESLPLGEEAERARRAIELASAGRQVALVSSGDAGIYALAGLVYEELGGDASLDIEVIPGITAASSAAALLGAPLMAGFAALSLSDLHVPADVIRRQLEAAAEADLVTVLYNPASQRRRALLAEAHQIFLAHRAPTTPVGLVRNAYRPDQTVRVHELATLRLDDVDMLTSVVIGSSQTFLTSGRMVTQRAYSPSVRASSSR